MKLHTKILLFMALGVVVGLILQATTEASYVQSSISIQSGQTFEKPALDPDCERAAWLAPFAAAAQVFMSLLKMLIVLKHIQTKMHC